MARAGVTAEFWPGSMMCLNTSSHQDVARMWQGYHLKQWIQLLYQ